MKNKTIAIQRRGKLRAASEKFLNQQGVEVIESESRLTSQCKVSGAKVLYLRDDDIPEYVLRGAADFGIVGENVIYEKKIDCTIVKRLGFGNCKLVLAVPEASSITTIEQLQGERIATSYPNLLRKYLEQQGIQAAIIPIQGSVEIAPELNLADAVCDITQTGNTLRAHNLTPLVTLLDSQACLITSE